MTALTSDRDTPRRDGAQFAFEAAETVYAGSMACLNADGKLVPASMAAGLSPVMGVVQRQGYAGETVEIRRGVFRFEAAGGDAPTPADVGRLCYAADDQTVSATQGANAPKAGLVRSVDEDGVWIEI